MSVKGEGRSNRTPYLILPLTAPRIMKKIKATLVRYFSYKAGTMVIVELPDGTETGIYVNRPDFIPLTESFNVRKQKDSEYYEMCPETREDTIDLTAKAAAKYGLKTKAE